MATRKGTAAASAPAGLAGLPRDFPPPPDDRFPFGISREAMNWGTDIAIDDQAYQDGLVDVLARRAPVYAHLAARLAVRALTRAYAMVRGPAWDAQTDPPPFTAESLYEVELDRFRSLLTPERLRAAFVPWIATTAMAGVLEPLVPFRGRLADDVASSDETKRRIAKLLDHPQHGLNARVDALMGRIPEDLVESQLEQLRPLQRTLAELEAFLTGADDLGLEVPPFPGAPDRLRPGAPRAGG